MNRIKPGTKVRVLRQTEPDRYRDGIILKSYHEYYIVRLATGLTIDVYNPKHIIID